MRILVEWSMQTRIEVELQYGQLLERHVAVAPIELWCDRGRLRNWRWFLPTWYHEE